MAEDKKLIQKDMGLILQLSSTYDIRKKGMAGRIINLMRERKALSSALGRIYLRRLNELDRDSDTLSDKICLFCRAMPSKDGVLCQYCMNEYSNNLLSFAPDMQRKSSKISKDAAASYFQESAADNASAPIDDTPAPIGDAFAPADDMPASIGNAFAPVDDMPAPIDDAFAPVDDMPTPIDDAFAPVDDMPAPIDDAFASVDDMPTPVDELLAPIDNASVLTSEPHSSLSFQAIEEAFLASEKVPPQAEEVIATVKKGGIFAKKKAGKAVNTLTEKVNELAGGEGSVDLRLRDLFSDVLKKHTAEEADELFIGGTKLTTPNEADIVANWPKPWLYTRVALWFFITFLILTFSYYAFHNTNLIPGIIFVGSFMIPMALIIFFYEVNAPRNISIFSVMKLFFVGGTASLLVTLFLFTLVEADMGFIGAIVVGIVEECGKLAIVAGLIKQIKGRRYILNGMLIGAAVGGGFAAFESAGYALRYFIVGTLTPGANGYDIMMNVILNRALLSPGGHITWAAIGGVATILALGDNEWSLSFVKKPVFYSLFAIPVIMHAVWDMPIRLFSIGPFSIVHIALIVIVWIVILVLLNRGLEELKHAQ